MSIRTTMAVQPQITPQLMNPTARTRQYHATPRVKRSVSLSALRKSFLVCGATVLMLLLLSPARTAASDHPYYMRLMPKPQHSADFQVDRVDLTNNHLPPYPTPDAFGAVPDSIPLANSLFDARAAAVVTSSVGDPLQVTVEPPAGQNTSYFALLEQKAYPNTGAPTVYLLVSKCLAAMAYADYFPDEPVIGGILANQVNQAVMEASPGWCGSLGPGGFDVFASQQTEGNYDMNEMQILALIYSYYDQLTPAARERAITIVAQGRIQRPNEDDTFTSGGAPNDWARDGYIQVGVLVVDIPETENHVLTIATARYLCNQLLYQRDHNPSHDNRRNGHPTVDGTTPCTEILLFLLRNMLSDGFAEYNAKPYQEETRWALLNLYNYAYDHEVRLAARMVLDYISAQFATSSDDLRRLVPFRRRNEEPYSHLLSYDQTSPDWGFMDVGLLEHGADPITPYFALLAGNTRGYELANHRSWDGTNEARPWAWGFAAAAEHTQAVLSDYRLPPSIHDLFVNDSHRRFFQRLHRFPHDEPGQQRNCENMEIYAGSPSYLITAGGRPAKYVIPGVAGFGNQPQGLGVAVPTTFMPTGQSVGTNTDGSVDLIQFSHFSDVFADGSSVGETENYGVAPDFACGYKLRLPGWATDSFSGAERIGPYLFVNKGGQLGVAGFFLAIHTDGDFALFEAFDTWRHPEVSYEQFKTRVLAANPNPVITGNQECQYTTQNGNRVHFVVWNHAERDNHDIGSKILSIDYGAGDPNDTLINAGNDIGGSLSTGGFLNGTVLKSPSEAVVEINNPFLGTRITLDMSDQFHPKRISETGQVEQAGYNHEVWVDFSSPANIPEDGDVFHPYKTLAKARDNVAGGGTVRIVTGATVEPITIRTSMTLVAMGGPVTISGR